LGTFIASSVSIVTAETIMPTKRRILIFLIVLTIMLLAKYAHGQDGSGVPEWEIGSCMDCTPSDEMYIASAMFYGVMCGVSAGLYRIWSRHATAQHADCFDTGLIQLRLS